VFNRIIDIYNNPVNTNLTILRFTGYNFIHKFIPQMTARMQKNLFEEVHAKDAKNASNLRFADAKLLVVVLSFYFHIVCISY